MNEVLESSPDEITYLQNYSYVFDPEKSCPGCTEDDYVVTPNVGVLVCGHACSCVVFSFQANFKILHNCVRNTSV